MLGTVKWFSAEKGYGFIAPDDGGAELFVHFTRVRLGALAGLDEGARVEFETIEGERGLQATSVGLASSERTL